MKMFYSILTRFSNDLILHLIIINIEEYKKVYQSLHLFGCTENSLFSYECNKTNNKRFETLQFGSLLI